MLELATFAPHRPEVPAPRYAKAYAGNLVPKTPAFDVLPTNPPSWMSKILPMDRADKEFVQQRWLARLRSVLAIDDLLASLRTELASLGVADNTYVIFSSDNGFHLGDHRLDYGKETAFDTDVNVPLVVAGPSVPAGRTDARMTSSIDLAPTFEQIAGADVPSTVDGTSMLPLWHGQSAPGWQKAILIEHRQSKNGSTDPDAQEIEPPSYEAVRTPGALYVEYSDGGTEYYDTATDPYELRNVADRAPAGMVRDLHQLKTCAGARRCQAAAGAR
jgi:arylsulfatase A-like enzyme